MPRGNHHYRGNGAKSGKTFGQAGIKWLDEWEGKTKQRQAIALKRLLPYIGTMPLYKINNAALAKFKEDRCKQVMAATVNKELNLISTIMNVAADIWEWIDYVPRIRGVKGPSRVAHALTWEEQDALFAELPDWWAKGPCLFAVNTGIRAGEMFGLQWDHIEPFMRGMVAVVLGKNGEERAVICNSLATLAVDRQRRNGSKYIFPSRAPSNKGGKMVEWGKIIDLAWIAASLPSEPLNKRGIHNLRHTCGHRHRRAGTPAEDRRVLLGHEKANLMEHYAEPDLERLMEHAEKIVHRPKEKEFMLRSIRNAG